jgi:hypothetical protein
MRLSGLLGVLLGFMVLPLSTVHAAPSNLAGSVDSAVGTPNALAVSQDGLLVGVVGSSGLSVYDLRAPSEIPVLSESCGESGAKAIVYVEDGSYGERFYVSCVGGGVEYLELDRTSVPVGVTSSEKISVNAGKGEAVGLAFADGDSAVFGVVQNSTTYSLDRIPLSATGGDSEVLGVLLTGTATAISVASSGSPLVVARNDGFVSEFTRTGDVYGTASTVPLVPLGALGDVLSSSEFLSTFATDVTNGEVWEIGTGLTTASEWGSGFSSPVSVAQGTSSSGPLLWVAEQAGTLTAWSTTEELQVEIDTEVTGLLDMAAPSSSADEVFAVASDGMLLVLHDRPVVSDLMATPASVLAGEPFQLSFGAAVAGDWDIRTGGTEDPNSGTSVAEGSLIAEETVTVELSADVLTAEGANRLYVFLSDGVSTGWDSVTVTLDTPPDEVTSAALGIGDERLYLSWETSDETDIATYEVYLSDQEFDEASLPSYSLTDEDGAVFDFPVSVVAEAPLTPQTYEVSGLTNGVTYFLALRALDEGGLVGPLSEVVSGAPAETCGAAECAEDLGCSCGQVPRTAGGLAPLLVLFIPLALLFQLRRRQF